MKSAGPETAHFFAPERHGDADVEPGLVDFAVNVRGGPPDFVRAALAAELDTLASYPSADRDAQVRDVIGAAHGRPASDVLLLGGAAEGFELLTRLPIGHAATVAPSFTEPGRVLAATGVRVSEITCAGPDWRLSSADVPDDADLVVVGNPTNPTSVLHPRSEIDALRRPGRVVVVDEAFADLTSTVDADGELVLEPESVAGDVVAELIVVRSVTKTFGLAGLRAGYLLAAPDLIARLTRGRRHWPVGSLALAALAACVSNEGRSYTRSQAHRVRADRDAMCARLAAAGIEVVGRPAAPFVTVRLPDALAAKERLRRKGFAVRSCANFTGLGPDYLRLAVRPDADVAALLAAL